MTSHSRISTISPPQLGTALNAKRSRLRSKRVPNRKQRVLLVGIYDTNSVALAPQILRAYVEQFEISERYEIRTKDLSIFTQSVEEMRAAIAAEAPDVVGFSAYIWNITHVLELVSGLEAVAVIGGPQMTELSEELIREHPAIDIIVEGEGEISFREILEYLSDQRELKDVLGITVQEGRTPKRTEAVELDRIPPLYERIFRENPSLTWITIETSRGCPYHCSFCTWGYSKSMRYYDLERVISDLDVILAQPTIEFIYFCDSSLILHKRRAKPILQHIIDSGTKKAVRYEMSAEQLDDELVELLSQLPNQEFNFGLQSISAGGQEHLRRPFRQEKFEHGYRKISAMIAEKRERGEAAPSVTIDLIYGLPGDSLSGYAQSLDYALSLDGTTRILTNPLLVLPGSDYFKEIRKHGIELGDRRRWVVKSTATFSSDDMETAREYSLYVAIVFFNERLRDAVKLFATDQNESCLSVIVEFFKANPLELPAGFPDMVPAHKDQFAYRNDVMRMICKHFPTLMREFSQFSGHRYDAQLADWREHFSAYYFKLRRYAGLPESQHLDEH